MTDNNGSLILPLEDREHYAVVLDHAITKLKDIPGEVFKLDQVKALRRLLNGNSEATESTL